MLNFFGWQYVLNIHPHRQACTVLNNNINEGFQRDQLSQEVTGHIPHGCLESDSEKRDLGGLSGCCMRHRGGGGGGGVLEVRGRLVSGGGQPAC